MEGDRTAKLFKEVEDIYQFIKQCGILKELSWA